MSGLLAYNVNLVRHSAATYVIIGFCGVTILLSLVNLILHSCFNSLRSKSGGTIFYILISELLFILCIMLSAIFFHDFK